MRYRIVATTCLLLLHLASAGAAAGEDFKVRIDGKVLRKSAGKLVISLSAFELSGKLEVVLENRKTGEKRAVALSSVYPDISYSEPLPADVIDSIDPGAWLPYIVWEIPDDADALRRRLSEIYEYQNRLRSELGRALLDEGGNGIKVSSRLTMNKIEKFHRIAALIAAEALKLAAEKDELKDFLAPLAIRIAFNPFEGPAAGPRAPSFHNIREVIYWEASRILNMQFGVREGLIDFVFESPCTVREFFPLRKARPEELSEFQASVTVEGGAIYAALYLQRQEFIGELKELIRVKNFRDPFIKDRPAIDPLVNEGKVVGVLGDRVAVTFAPPFMKREEVVYIALDPGGKEEVPAVLLTTVDGEGYSVTGGLPAETVARIRPGMPVRRK